MHAVIAYDISDNETRTKVFKLLKELGVNSQRSVFECELQPEEIRHIVSRIAPMLDSETDSLLVYPLCRRCAAGVEILGQGMPLVEMEWKVI